MTMRTWEAAWEIEFPAHGVEELLLALVVRDLAHGTSYDIQLVEDGSELALDFFAGDELDEATYRLLLSAEIAGSEQYERVQEFTGAMIEELVEEAQELVARRRAVGARPLSELHFRPVPEAEERWDLVIPDWLAPEGAEVPFGFRSFDRERGEPWPANEALDSSGRVVVVPYEGQVHAFSIPAPSDSEEADPPGPPGGLPIHPHGAG